MPALPGAPGVVKIVLVQALQGVTVNNVLHAQKDNLLGWTQTDLQSLANLVRSTWVTNVIPLQGTVLTLSDCIVTDITDEFGLSATATGSTAGTASGTAQPANCCVCWSWKIGLRYRGGHPRTYVAGMTAGAVSNPNTLSPTHVTAQAAAAAALRTAVNGFTTGTATVALGAVSYWKNKALRVTPIFLPYTGVSVDNRIDSQRRRLGRDRT